jgi:hypothetical protein
MELKPKSIASRMSSKNSTIRSKVTEYKKIKLIDMISKMDDDEVDQLSR